MATNVALVEREERAWQAMTRVAGWHGMYWALVKVLIRRGFFTIDDLRDQVADDTGVRDVQ